MKNLLLKIFPVLAISLVQWTPAFAITASSVYEANTLCTYPFSCNGETIAPDMRPSLQVSQPVVEPAKGNCSTLPASQSYMARPLSLTCGTADTVRVREKTEYPQEKLDENLDYIKAGNPEKAQQVLKSDLVWQNPLKFSVRETWTYKRKVGGYGCGGSYGAEGGAPETYQTTCYRTGRQERVLRAVHHIHRYCSRASAPPPPPQETTPTYSDKSSRASNYGGGTYSGSGSSSTQRNDPPPAYKRDMPTQPKGNRESNREDRLRRGFDSGSSNFGGSRSGSSGSRSSSGSSSSSSSSSRSSGSSSSKRRDSDNREVFTAQYRSPAYNSGLRRVYGMERTETTTGAEPAYGCDSWSERDLGDTWEEITVQADDIQYSCTKTRSQWCTWYEDATASQMCPEQKTANVTVKYVTPNDWNPSNPNYDDQLPNKYDLLLGESELVKISANIQTGSTMSPAIKIANATADSFGNVRTKNWNEYETRAIPSAVKCEYKDQNFTIEVNTLHRNVQAAPNPLIVPKDEKGNEIALSTVDEKGRPALLSLLNPGRNMVLDRSNISRIFGEREAADGMSTSTITEDKKVKKGGISKKFWENTKFHMRLLWWDGKNCTVDPSKCREVKVTQARPFNLTQARPVGDDLTISLDGKYGMDKFYKISVPYEEIFGFLGGDFALDPKKDYYLEIKLAQPYFKGIYLDGRKTGGKHKEEDAAIDDKKAYSEPKYILLRAPNAKRGFWDWFWHYQSNRSWRP